MKRQAIIVSALAALLAPNAARAVVIAQWTFNSSPSDNASNTGTTGPEFGTGTVSLLGVSDSFAQGSNNDTSATAAGNNNSSYNTSNYPPFDSDNKTAGIQVAVDTTGYRDIILSFEHRHAAGASAAFRIQYSSNGVNYTDGTGYNAFGSENVFHLRGQDFSGIPALDDNPNARFRIVAEFVGMMYQATGSGSNYMPAANNRFDLVTVSGTLIPEPGLPGDYNQNGVVDAADYVVWRKTVGTNTALPNDLISGTIGTAQYNQWRANFGQTTPGAGSGSGISVNAPVPEPSALVLLIVAATGACLRRGRAAKKVPITHKRVTRANKPPS